MRLSATLSIVAALTLLGCGAASDGAGDEESPGVSAAALVDLVGTTTPNGPGPLSGVDQVTGFAAPSRPKLLLPAGAADPSLPPPDPPNPAEKAILGPTPGFFGFDGLTHRDQLLAGTGIYTNTQRNVEPPDPVVCAGNGFVVEVVNDALAVYSTSGAELAAPTPLNQFFRLPPMLDRTTMTFGPSVADPKCYFDGDTRRFFVTAAEVDTNPTTGAFSGTRSRVEIAVSRSDDPTGAWFLFALDTTSNGQAGTPSVAGCPCIGDQPLIGADKNGFFISVNAFTFNELAFAGAQIYALSKAALVAGAPPKVVVFPSIPPGVGEGASIQPAITPPGGAFESANRGTEYFMSSLLTGQLENRIAVWTITNTRSLHSAVPSLTLRRTLVDSEVYGLPPPVPQRPGPTPLGTTFLPQIFNQPPEPEELLDTMDERMQQVFFADGKLWSGLTTVIGSCDATRAGVAFFIVKPCPSRWKVRAEIVNQGYIAAGADENAIYPAVGVNPSGEGAIAYTLVGPGFFPSAAYSLLDVNGAGDVHIAREGVAPEDGFTGYMAFGGNGIARWGDYSGAAVDENGKVWMSTEYIPDRPRTILANWGTFLANVAP